MRTGLTKREKTTDIWFDEKDPLRSEEHTSELQSPVPIAYAVFCLKKHGTASIPPTSTWR